MCNSVLIYLPPFPELWMKGGRDWRNLVSEDHHHREKRIVYNNAHAPS